jgi:hypothetical protein
VHRRSTALDAVAAELIEDTLSGEEIEPIIDRVESQ